MELLACFRFFISGGFRDEVARCLGEALRISAISMILAVSNKPNSLLI